MPVATSSLSVAPERHTTLDPRNKKQTLWVGDLEPYMDETYIYHAFMTAGSVANVRVVRDKLTGTPTCGFVQFHQSSDAQRLHSEQSKGNPHTDSRGHRFKVNWASFNIGDKLDRPSENEFSLYVGNLDQSVSEGHLYNLFAESYTSVIGCKICTDMNTNAPKGFAFVRFADEAEAKQAIQTLNHKMLGSRLISVKPAKNTKSAKGYDPCKEAHNVGGATDFGVGAGMSPTLSNDQQHVLNLWGLSSSVTEAHLLHYFATFGPIVNVRVAAEQNYGAVQFQHSESLQAANFFLQQATSQLQGMHGQESAPRAYESPVIHNRTTVQAQSKIEASHHGPVFDDTAVAKAAHAWSAELFGGNRFAVTPLALANFQVALQYPVFVQAFENLLKDSQERSPVEPTADATDGPLEEQCPMWLLQDRPELFAGESCANQMNDDFARHDLQQSLDDTSSMVCD